MPRSIAPSTLRHLLDEGSELALIDVREHGEYNAAHIPGASSLPRRLIEFRLQRLVPSAAVQIVLCDDDERRARLAGVTATRMGYVRVAVLEGGVHRWASLGLPTEWGMNVPSKEFGERVEVQQHVPSIDAVELHTRTKRGEQFIILDTRTPEEYRRACIPGGRNTPGGELAYRIGDILKGQSDASVVVNCAGRTRSIIGTRILQRMGLKNVAALKNGTAGWTLAGLPLERDARRTALPDPTPERLAAARAFAGRIAAEDGVRSLPIDSLRDVLATAGQGCVYLVDVRTQEEYVAGHLPGFWWFPGGQAVQCADDLVAVRDATIVFCCDSGIRSTIAGSWYRQMGFPNVFVVEGGTTAWANAGRSLEAGPDPQQPFGLEAACAGARQVAPRGLQSLLSDSGPTVLFVDTSREFASGHVPGARWVSRSWLELRIEALVPRKGTCLVITDPDGESAPLAAATLCEMGYSDVSILAGGMAAWRRAGLPVEQGLSGVMTPPDDVVPAGPDRPTHDMINYLHWEESLGQKYRVR